MTFAQTLRQSSIFRMRAPDESAKSRAPLSNFLDSIRFLYAYKRILDGDFLQTGRGVHRQIDYVKTIIALGEPMHWVKALASGNITNLPEQASLALTIESRGTKEDAKLALDLLKQKGVRLGNSYATQVLEKKAGLCN